MTHEIPYENTVAVDDFKIMGEPVAFDLRYTIRAAVGQPGVLFHGVTIPFYNSLDMPIFFAANEPAKPPL